MVSQSRRTSHPHVCCAACSCVNARERSQVGRMRTLNPHGVEIPGSPSASSSLWTSRITGLFCMLILFGRQNRPVAVSMLVSTSRNGRGLTLKERLRFFSCVGEAELLDVVPSFPLTPSCAAQPDGRPLRLQPSGYYGGALHTRQRTDVPLVDMDSMLCGTVNHEP